MGVNLVMDTNFLANLHLMCFGSCWLGVRKGPITASVCEGLLLAFGRTLDNRGKVLEHGFEWFVAC